jgi:hypothetical protein
MGGDQLDGFAYAAMFATALLVVALALLIFVLRQIVTGRPLPRPRGPLAFVTAAISIVVVGYALVSSFAPSVIDSEPQLHLVTAPGFNEPWVLLLEDPRGRELIWTDSWNPLSSPTARLEVPPNGIVRLRSFGPIAGRMNISIHWPGGLASLGGDGGPAPPGSGATRLFSIPYPGTTMPSPNLDENGLAAYLATREPRR